MTTYAYLCLDARGTETRGQMDAPDEGSARRQLREQGLKILELAEGAISGGGAVAVLRSVARGISRYRSVNNADRVLFFNQMQLMLKAGHTILEALAAASRLTRKARLSGILDRVAAGIQRGSSLSVACGGEKELFNRIALKLIEAGEVSGELSAVFERIAAMIERRAEAQRQLMTALIYPGIIILAVIGLLVMLVNWVIPRFAVFLSGRGKALPWTTQTLMDSADWFTAWGGTIGLGAVAFIVGILLGRRIPPARRIIDRVALSLPMIGGTLTLAAMAQVTWIFGLLIKSRLTVLEALRICTQVMGNAAYSGAFTEAADDVLTGKTLAVALDRAVLPRLVQHMAAIGEKSGQMDTVMESLGIYYQKALESRVKLLASLVEPVITVLVGVVVGFVYYSFFVALLSLSTGA